MVIYVIEQGDTVYSIAAEYGVPPSLIITDNAIPSPDTITPGQAILIRQPTETYVVKDGDTLSSIATTFGITIYELYRNNPILDGKANVYPGELLVIRGEAPTGGTIFTNGYIYPFVDTDTLRRTLPYLSYLTLFTYGINRDGTLIPPGASEGIPPEKETEIIALAREYGVTPIMLLSTLTAEGVFSNELADYIFSNPDVEAAVIRNVVDTVISRGYGGVDLDFEYIGGDLADNYVNFVRNVNNALDARGDYVTLVALAPKSSATQPGLLYEGHRYGELAEAADAALLMTYEWGYTYGPPMAVAPIDQVRRVVDYAMTEMTPDKAILGIPNYGYDWTLPYVRGESMARSLSNTDAVEKAVAAGARIMFDELAQAPFYSYYSNENGSPKEHVVWFEDPRSVRAKLSLIEEYGLVGGSVWNIMRWFPQLWLQINDTFDIYKAKG